MAIWFFPGGSGGPCGARPCGLLPVVGSPVARGPLEVAHHCAVVVEVDHSNLDDDVDVVRQSGAILVPRAPAASLNRIAASLSID